VSRAGDDEAPEEIRAEAFRMMRRAGAVPGAAEILAMRAAALARPRPGVSDAEIYATAARLLALRARADALLAQLAALLAGDQGGLTWGLPREGEARNRAGRRARSCTRPPGRGASAGP
jgi:hypothetical protein